MHNLTAFPKTYLNAWGTFELRTACKHVTWPSLANWAGESRVSVLTMRQYVNMPRHELHKPPLPAPANVPDSVHYVEHDNSKSKTSAMRSFCTTILLTHTVRHPYVNYFPRSLRQSITVGATFKHNFNTSSFATAAEQSVHIIKPVTRNDVGAFQPGSSVRKQHVITLHNANTHKHVVTINKYKMYA